MNHSERLKHALDDFQNGKLETAKKKLTEMVGSDNTITEAFHLLGHISNQNEETDTAISYFEKACAIAPSNFNYHNNLGVVLASKKELDQAETTFKKSLTLNPNNAEAHNNLGSLLVDKKEFEKALDHFFMAIALKPEYSAAYANLANGMRRVSRMDEALIYYQKALDLDPNNAEAWCNFGLHYGQVQNFEKAIECYQKAIDIRPKYAQAQYNLSLIHLSKGDLIKGFTLYDWRWKLWSSVASKFDQPEWQGEEFFGKTLLILFEQGVGDGIQFVRYLDKVAQRGSNIIVRADDSLHAILR